MRSAWKIAVAGVLAAGVAVYFTGLLPRCEPLAFAEVAAKLRDARTLTCKHTIKNPKRKESETAKLFFKEPGLHRLEGDGQISIAIPSKTKRCSLIQPRRPPC